MSKHLVCAAITAMASAAIATPVCYFLDGFQFGCDRHPPTISPGRCYLETLVNEPMWFVSASDTFPGMTEYTMTLSDVCKWRLGVIIQGECVDPPHYYEASTTQSYIASLGGVPCNEDVVEN